MNQETKKSEEMEAATEKQNEELKKIYTVALQEIKAGADKTLVSERLAEMGVDKAAAEEIYDQFVRHAEQEKYTKNSIIRGLIGGIIGAVIGGAIWGLLAVVTSYEIGFAALGVGGLAGYMVVIAAKGKKGIPLQLIAVSCSIVGIVIGKYFTFYSILTRVVAERYGAEVVSPFSGAMLQLFAENIGLLMSPYDLLWFGLAIYTAWRIPRAMGVRFPRQAG